MSSEGSFRPEAILATGVAEIDADHKALDRLFRRVERAIFDDRGQLEVLALYDAAIAAVEAHFAAEDGHLAGWPARVREAHRQAHALLLDKAARIRGEIAATSGQRSIKALFDFEDALYQHTIAFDIVPLRQSGGA
jgi:hemerythrin-like metal-binding protein